MFQSFICDCFYLQVYLNIFLDEEDEIETTELMKDPDITSKSARGFLLMFFMYKFIYCYQMNSIEKHVNTMFEYSSPM